MAALKRKANWSEKEIVCLVSEVTENILLLSSKHDGNERSEKSKSVFWKELSERYKLFITFLSKRIHYLFSVFIHDRYCSVSFVI